MSWKVFAGAAEDIYWGLLVVRAKRDGIPLERDTLNNYFRLHLHRGISYLNGNATLRGIADLARLAHGGAG
jgi:DNA sulfur modification protein DndE